jgi:hypothetical protein
MYAQHENNRKPNISRSWKQEGRKRFSSECYNVDTTWSIVDSFKIDFVYAVDALSSSCFQDLEKL